MRFYDRDNEIQTLRRIRDDSSKAAQFTVITGRRRIGKTALALNAYAEGSPMLYFFVGRKSEAELCESFVAEIRQKLDVLTIGETDKFADIFEYLMKLSASMPFTLFIDEFQEFYRVNKSIFSDMQRIWDSLHSESRVNLIVCGSVYSLMSKIFKDNKEPLYGRQTNLMTLSPFPPSVLKRILRDNNPAYENEDLLALFLFSGGIAKYVDLLMDAGAVTKKKMIEYVIRPDSVFISEGQSVLIEEFGRDYGVYFSILTSIARGRNTRSDIENVIGRQIGGYLTKLEHDYGLIAKKQPLYEASSNKNVHYSIDDNFYLFWFRFIYKYNYILEIGGFDKLKEIVERDYETFSGLILERYFRDVLIEGRKFTRIGGWWDRKGENEIDIIAEDELSDEASFYEVKRNPANIDLAALQRKAESFFKATGRFIGYKISYKALSIEDM